MSNLEQFRSGSSSITLTSTTTVAPTSESDSVTEVDPTKSNVFYLRSGDVQNVVYFKLLDGTYDGQTVTILRDRHNGWHTYDPGTGTGDAGIRLHYRGVDYSSPGYGYKWSWDPDIGYAGGTGIMNRSLIAKWSKNHWILFEGSQG